jgi:deoxyribose-phosphate aldolase
MQEYNAGMTEERAGGEESARPQFVRYEDLAARVSLSLAAPAITEEEVYEGCQAAIARSAAEVLVRPSDVDLCKNWLAGSAVKLSSLTGFPGGSSTTAARLYEARDVVRRGVTELAVAMNLGKLVSRKFLYLESELMQLAEQCHQASAKVRAVFETDHLQQDHVLIGVRLIKRTGFDAVDLQFQAGATPPGPALDRMAAIVRYVFHHARGKFAVRVLAPSLSWETAQVLLAAGADAFAITNAAAVLDAWREELQRREEEARKQATAALESPATAPLEAPPSE